MTKAIDQMMEQAVERGIFPSSSLLVGREGEIIFEKHYGKARSGTCFDIASLTKPIATATLAMQFAQEGLLKLTDTVYQWLGGARLPAHREMMVAYLLSHASGLPAWKPYYRELPTTCVGTKEGKDHIVQACLKEPVVFKPGTQCVYSDLGFIILGEILEQAGSASLDVLFQNRIAKTLGLKDTFFIRNAESTVHSPQSIVQKKRFAPTEDCPWRKKVVCGEVHDQNAYAMGGVAGHAGLFSTTTDLHAYISHQFTQLRTLNFELRTPSTYVLGWDTPTFGQSSSGSYFSPHSIGHLGYTGCSMWIDLDKNFWVVLLTNRIHPSSTNEKIKAFRPKIHNLIWKELNA